MIIGVYINHINVVYAIYDYGCLYQHMYHIYIVLHLPYLYMMYESQVTKTKSKSVQDSSFPPFFSSSFSFSFFFMIPFFVSCFYLPVI